MFTFLRQSSVYCLLLISGLLFQSCGNDSGAPKKVAADDLVGLWEAKIQVSDQTLPFRFEIEKEAGDPVMYLINAEERIKVEDIGMTADSVAMGMHIFNTLLQAKYEDETLTGSWIKQDYEDYVLPFEAYKVSSFQETEPSAATADITGKWEVTFEGEDGEDEPAVGIFSQEGAKVTGTFLTPLGDYRYLSGELDGNRLELSCFDGEHAFLFRAMVGEDKLKNGEFWSGKSWKQDWSGEKNPNATLADPKSLTYLKEGYEEISFTFPNLEGKPVSLSDEKYRGKVVLVQLMGSWCPNCMDETAFLSSYYKKHKDEGLEIIALAFERDPALEAARPRLQKLIDRFDMQYDILVAGSNSKKEASEKLPMLNEVISFPTTVFIDREGDVRRIHTGFSGPGTGRYYEECVEEFRLFMSKLLEEQG